MALDAMFGEETPAAVMALLERPVGGPVTWAASESDYVDLRFVTSDGALDERWTARATYMLSGTLGGAGGISVDLTDPRPFAGSLMVTERDGVAEAWENRELAIQLYFITNPLDFVGMHGSVRYLLSNASDGEGEAATVTIAEFALPPS